MKYFGTDGIRGIYGETLDDDLAFRTGLAAAAYFEGGSVVVGRDTRVSGGALAEAFKRGLVRGGATALDAGIVPVAAVSCLVIKRGAAGGAMISASHNPPEYNGVKLFDGRGAKLSDAGESAVERYIDSPPAAVRDGRAQNFTSAFEDYAGHVLTRFPASRFSGVSVALDCGNGAAGAAAPEIFKRAGFKIKAVNCDLRGETINCGCGALHPSHIKGASDGFAFGFAFDGDADRLATVCGGEEIDGDSVLYNLSRAVALKDDAVVGTVLNNTALEDALAEDGRKLYRTDVGDKYIGRLMAERGYNLGGEQSGHFIISPPSVTGDGILAALYFAAAVTAAGAPRALKLYPQRAIAFPSDGRVLKSAAFASLKKKWDGKLKGRGRVVTRMSGTEPVARVMVEARDSADIDLALSEFSDILARAGSPRP